MKVIVTITVYNCKEKFFLFTYHIKIQERSDYYDNKGGL